MSLTSSGASGVGTADLQEPIIKFGWLTKQQDSTKEVSLPTTPFPPHACDFSFSFFLFFKADFILTELDETIFCTNTNANDVL